MEWHMIHVTREAQREPLGAPGGQDSREAYSGWKGWSGPSQLRVYCLRDSGQANHSLASVLLSTEWETSQSLLPTRSEAEKSFPGIPPHQAVTSGREMSVRCSGPVSSCCGACGGQVPGGDAVCSVSSTCGCFSEGWQRQGLAGPGAAALCFHIPCLHVNTAGNVSVP